MRRARMRTLLAAGILGGGGVRYLLHDDFTDDRAAGAVNLTNATDGKSVRYVSDASNLLSLAAGKATASGSQASADDFKPGLWYDAFHRGHVMVATVTPGTRGPDYVGWMKTPEDANAGPYGPAYALRFAGGLGLYAGIYNTNSLKLGDFVAGTTYQVAVIAKTASNEIWIKGGAWAAWTQLHTDATVTDYVLFPAISWYFDTSPRTSHIDNLRVCPYVGDNFDAYFTCGGSARTIVPIALFGDSKSIGYYWPGLLNTNTHVFQEIPTGRRVLGAMPGRIATAGATIASRVATIAADLAAISETPLFVLWNIGVNDMDGALVEATWKANCQTIINAMAAKWPSVKIYMMRPWQKAPYTTAPNTIATWIADLIAANPGVCFLGPDERVFLEGGDDGATWLVDDRHPTVPAGYQLTADQWRSAIGY
jgi:hypothetical protein